MTDPLPIRFILHVPSRNSTTDPYSGFIMVSATMNPAGDAYILADLPWSALPPDTYNITIKDAAPAVYLGTYSLWSPKTSTALKKRVHDLSAKYVVKTEVGTKVRVIEVPRHVDLFAGRIKRNIVIKPSPTAAATPTLSPSPAPPLTPSLTDVIHHVVSPPPPPKSKPKSAFTVSSSSIARYATLSPFVAKQLLELAQIKHDLCPIVAEEFSTGNTAVMPCGHLFAQIAIEESFKKEPNKCPACRQLGKPTYV